MLFKKDLLCTCVGLLSRTVLVNYRIWGRHGLDDDSGLRRVLARRASGRAHTGHPGHVTPLTLRAERNFLLKLIKYAIIAFFLVAYFNITIVA